MRRLVSQLRLRSVLILVWASVCATLGAFAHAQIQTRARLQEHSYRSPYKVEFTLPDLIADLEHGERGDPRLEAEVPFHEWYSRRTLERWHSWGPPPRSYPPPAGLERWNLERKRERAVAVALRFLGYAYQHHHIPDWNPPEDWPWMKCCAGKNGKGVDCSNFTGFVYNIGFGLRLNSDVHLQSQERAAKGHEGKSLALDRVELPASFEERLRVLRTGDLIYIRARSGKISHVVLWVGPIGRSPDGSPLIIDSHGEDVKDSEGNAIPCGVRLRPFRENSWYNQSASHALRVLHD